MTDEVRAAAAEERRKTYMAKIEAKPELRSYHTMKKELASHSQEMAKQLLLKRQLEKQETRRREMEHQESFRRHLAKEAALKAQQRDAVEQSIIQRKERSEVTRRLRNEIVASMELRSVEFKAVGEQKAKLSRLRIQSLEEERKRKIEIDRETYERRLNRAREWKRQEELEVQDISQRQRYFSMSSG